MTSLFEEDDSDALGFLDDLGVGDVFQLQLAYDPADRTGGPGDPNATLSGFLTPNVFYAGAGAGWFLTDVSAPFAIGGGEIVTDSVDVFFGGSLAPSAGGAEFPDLTVSFSGGVSDDDATALDASGSELPDNLADAFAGATGGFAFSIQSDTSSGLSFVDIGGSFVFGAVPEPSSAAVALLLTAVGSAAGRRR